MSLPSQLTPAVLNDLYRRHEKTDIRERSAWLGAELKRMHAEHHQREVEETFAVVLGAPYVFLDSYPGGAVSSDALWAEHDAEIRRQSPWLDEQNFQRACHQSRYYAWHDGLVKSS